MSDEGLAKQLARFQEGSPFSPYDEKTGRGLERGEPTPEELREQYAAPGRDADVDLGVLYRADHETLEDGLCRQARAHARALGAELPVALRSVNNRVRIKDPVTGERIVVLGSDDALAPAVYAEVGELRKRTIRRNAVCVNHTVITSAANLWRLLVPGYAQNEPKAVESILAASVVYTPWERDRVEPDTIALLNNVGQVWLQCEANVRAFTSSGLDPERVRLVPNAFDVAAPLYGLWREQPAMARPTGRRFYTIGKWEPRKNHHGLIGAFMRAFAPSEMATLYVKTYEYRPWPGYPGLDESVAHWLADPAVVEKGWTAENFRSSLFVDTRYVSDRGIAEIHLRNNLYVSASHAEGWDYPAFDAVSIGNRLVHVGYGGSEDYAPPGSVRVAWEAGPVDSAYGWEGGATWAHYSLEALTDALRRARPGVPPADVPVAAVLDYRAEVIGRLMARHVRELAMATGQELP